MNARACHRKKQIRLCDRTFELNTNNSHSRNRFRALRASVIRTFNLESLELIAISLRISKEFFAKSIKRKITERETDSEIKGEKPVDRNHTCA